MTTFLLILALFFANTVDLQDGLALKLPWCGTHTTYTCQSPPVHTSAIVDPEACELYRCSGLAALGYRYFTL